MELPVEYSPLSWKERRIVRQMYIEKQGGKCHYCGAPLDEKPREDIARKPVQKKWFPKRFFDHPIHLHHNHDTDRTIGAVHAYCNAVLWIYHGE